jgi:CRP/FNR family transcriptional regulator, cyclic AMP receptor protein
MARQDRNRKNFDDGRYVFREHEVGDEAFIIEEGTVEIVRLSEDGVNILASIGPGEIFGEMALIDDSPRMASARTVGRVTLTVITRALFSDKLKATDPFIRGLLTIMAAEARRLANEKLTSM